MKLTVVFQEFEQIAEELNIRILQEKGNFNGGYCLLEEQRMEEKVWEKHCGRKLWKQNRGRKFGRRIVEEEVWKKK